ncbi:MAG: hypothetical protein M3295_01675 [Chloroflexota bacterium]|nr:hypothetical protein [Chloroflexota bacterium]
MDQQQGGGSQGHSPVDNNTYNLLQVLTSKLEALQAYATYERDADERSRPILQELTQQDQQAVERVMQALRESLR